MLPFFFLLPMISVCFTYGSKLIDILIVNLLHVEMMCVLIFQYYYNPKTSQFMYWDAEKSTYLPAPSQSSDTSTEQAGENAESGEGSSESSKDPKKDKERDKKDKEKNKVAKKIAKVCWISA